MYTTVWPWHTGFEKAETLRLTGRFELTFRMIRFDVAGFPVTQVTLEVSWHVTVSPFKGI